MNPAVVRNEIEPLLSELLRALADEGRATEHAIYRAIRRCLLAASSSCELARPFHDLSSMATVRPVPSPANDANILLARILQKAEQLTLADVETHEVH